MCFEPELSTEYGGSFLSLLIVPVPRLNDSHVDFMAMGKIWRNVINMECSTEVHFDFSHCEFLQPNAVAFLGGLAHVIAARGGTPRFLVPTMSDPVRVNLLQNGFACAMGDTTLPWEGNSIPYREYREHDRNQIVQDLRRNWLGRGWINISDALANEVVGQVWEIFANAFEHSRTSMGVYCCGQYFSRRKMLTLAVADFGVGIPSNVRLHLQRPVLQGAETMRWAFQRGTSTSCRLDGPRGVGLDLLKELVRATKGTMLIYSHDGCARIDHRGETYENFRPYFEGTLVQIVLRCDDQVYMLSNEAAGNDVRPFF